MNILQFLRKTRKFLSSNIKNQKASPFKLQTEQYDRAIIGIHFFYLCSLINCLSSVFESWPMLHDLALDHPQWIFQFLDWQRYKHLIIDLICYGYFLASFFAVFYPSFRWLRIIVFLSLLGFVGLINSDGHGSHYMHMMMYPTFMFIFLPKFNRSTSYRLERAKVLHVFFMAQLSICIAYEMAGYSKITEILRCLYNNGTQGCEFGSRIMTHMAAMEDIQYRWPTFSGDFLYQFPWMGGILYYTIIWIHLISIVIAFRPHLHRFFMFYRICFHFGTLIFFGIGFTPNILAVISVFALSPFYFKVPLLKIIFDLPPLTFFKICKK